MISIGFHPPPSTLHVADNTRFARLCRHDNILLHYPREDTNNGRCHAGRSADVTIDVRSTKGDIIMISARHVLDEILLT